MKPVIVTDLELVFGGNMSELLPPIDDIPEEFKVGKNKWNKVVRDWFFYGLNKCEWKASEGVKTNEALRHIAAILKSFEPSHEHKMAGAAYLLSEFFDDVKYELAKPH